VLIFSVLKLQVLVSRIRHFDFGHERNVPTQTGSGNRLISPLSPPGNMKTSPPIMVSRVLETLGLNNNHVGI
jgi:hypothetical protein